MINRACILMVALLGIVTTGFAQTTDQDLADRSTVIFEKATRVDLYNQILPILLTKEEYRDLLPAIEKARQKVRDTQKLEAGELAKLEAKLDSAIKEADEKGLVPPRELLTSVSQTLSKFTFARRIIAESNTNDVYTVFMKITNAGQQKAAANALNPRYFAPNVKPEEMKDEDKIKIYVREILLHPVAYDIMRQLSKKSS